MAGGKSLSENYAFSGMHHIFDQHTATGLWDFTCLHPQFYTEAIIKNAHSHTLLFDMILTNSEQYFSKVAVMDDRWTRR